MDDLDLSPSPEAVCAICFKLLHTPVDSTDASGWLVYLRKPGEGPSVLDYAHSRCYILHVLPADGWYSPTGRTLDGVAMEDEEPPCTCKPDCPSSCKGGCGCQHCHDAYQDFLSMRDE